MNALTRAAVALMLGCATLALAPPAAASVDYECTSYPLVTTCAGVDRYKSCLGKNAHYDWGADAFVFGGFFVGIGGTHVCSQGTGGTNETTRVDGGVYSHYARGAISWEDTTSQQGENVGHRCTMVLQAWLFAYRSDVPVGCVIAPTHPGSLLP